MVDKSTIERFFIELPGDRYGNRSFTAAVVGGFLTDEGRMLNITAPNNFPWKQVHAEGFAKVSEEAGPPRYLTNWSEMDLILTKYKKYIPKDK